ncbi:MAG: SMP-30/gluconolactonase/LRE family protein [Acidimicrobiia bacterium]|nr:SMP-30/gluconolactonase/LRE family protein [Acidimicrobiia bacterium]
MAQSPAGSHVVRLDPALDAIIAPDARIEILKEDYFGATEGPVWVKDGGYLLFSDQAANRVYKWADGELSVHLEPSGFTGNMRDVNLNGAVYRLGRLYVALLGSNGLAIDHEGRLVLCTHGDRALVRIEKDGSRTVLADRYDGKKLNGPNDLAIASDGSIYFTDLGVLGDKELPPSVYRWKEGTLQLLASSVQGGFANGIALSPDERHLYVAASRKIVRYDVQPDGRVANETVFVDMSQAKERGGPDGIKVDRAGNVWFGGPGGLWIVSPAGTHLGTILNERNVNMAFGDADGRGLYVTTFTGLVKIRLQQAAF